MPVYNLLCPISSDRGSLVWGVLERVTILLCWKEVFIIHLAQVYQGMCFLEYGGYLTEWNLHTLSTLSLFFS